MKEDVKKINSVFRKKLFMHVSSKDVNEKLIPAGFTWSEVLKIWFFPMQVPANRLFLALKRLGLTDLMFELNLMIVEHSFKKYVNNSHPTL